MTAYNQVYKSYCNFNLEIISNVLNFTDMTNSKNYTYILYNLN